MAIRDSQVVCSILTDDYTRGIHERQQVMQTDVYTVLNDTAMHSLRSHMVWLIHVPESLPEIEDLTLVFRGENQLLSTSGAVAGKCWNNTPNTSAQSCEK